MGKVFTYLRGQWEECSAYSGGQNATLTDSYKDNGCYAVDSAKWNCPQNYVGTIGWKVNQSQLMETLATSGGALVENGWARP